MSQYGGSGIMDGEQGPHGLKSYHTTTGVVIDGGSWSHNTEDGFQTNSAGVGVVLTIRNLISEDNSENALDVKDGILVVDNVIFKTNQASNPVVTLQSSAEALFITNSVLEVEYGIATNALHLQQSSSIVSESNLYIGGDSSTLALNSLGSGSFLNDIILRTFGNRSTAAVVVDQSDHQMDHVTVYVATNKRAVHVRGDGSSIDLDNAILYAADGTIAALIEVERVDDLTGDNDFLYRVTGATYVDWDGADYTARQVTDGTLQAAEGVGDSWFVALDPMFVDAAGGDFTLASGSTATGLGATADDAFGM